MLTPGVLTAVPPQPLAHAGDWVGAALFAVPVLVLVLAYRVLSRLGGEQDLPIEVADGHASGTGADPG